ncbi:MAG: hypothetical protein LBC61_06760 [Candidatus Peribacteria bacterium]|nr:hypothetical protein [Candidatus Peribacteria bacterium]
MTFGGKFIFEKIIVSNHHLLAICKNFFIFGDNNGSHHKILTLESLLFLRNFKVFMYVIKLISFCKLLSFILSFAKQ